MTSGVGHPPTFSNVKLGGRNCLMVWMDAQKVTVDVPNTLAASTGRRETVSPAASDKSMPGLLTLRVEVSSQPVHDKSGVWQWR